MTNLLFRVSIVCGLGLTAACAPVLEDAGLQSTDPANAAARAEAAVIDLAPSRGPGFAPPMRPVLDLTQTRPDFPPPPSNARTVEEFDTTTAEARAEAVAAAPTAGETRLGTTIASLGSPTDPGIWLKTPLVTTAREGRIDYNGTSVAVELRPSGGVAGSGSQISLPAMRLLGAPLTGLLEITVYGS